MGKPISRGDPISRTGNPHPHTTYPKRGMIARELSDSSPFSLLSNFSNLFATKMVSFGEPWPEFNDGIYYRDLLRPSDAGATLIDFYSRKYKSSAPLHGWLQRIHNKQITIDGCVVTDPKIILRGGEELVYHRLPWKEPDAPYLLEILYEDNDVFVSGKILRYEKKPAIAKKRQIALNKPSGLQVLPGGLFQQRTVLTQLQRHADNLTASGYQEPHPVPVHRLGRGTSADGTSAVGVCRMNDTQQKATRNITKLYRALASGVIIEDEVFIDQPIGLVKYPGVAKGLYVASPSGKPALSKVVVLERNLLSNSTLVQVEIQSGRPHQIRIHLSFIGHPLVGGRDVYLGRRLCLNRSPCVGLEERKRYVSIFAPGGQSAADCPIGRPPDHLKHEVFCFPQLSVCGLPYYRRQGDTGYQFAISMGCVVPIVDDIFPLRSHFVDDDFFDYSISRGGRSASRPRSTYASTGPPRMGLEERKRVCFNFCSSAPLWAAVGGTGCPIGVTGCHHFYANMKFCFPQLSVRVAYLATGDPLYSTDGQPKFSDHESVDESFAQDGGYERPEKPVPGDCGYHLHAHHVVFSHPLTNEINEISAPLPLNLHTVEESKAKKVL
ncbi:hypothetical protein DH2020_021604 [Rehmannia glutinosa]|uniref:Pseudouridine synthase RsuA/RluA-like domain-containing protein n=1 Tax=Rehmannia glutinosa TaxID=99300 RepID=A0ABR0WFD0_REHGL